MSAAAPTTVMFLVEDKSTGEGISKATLQVAGQTKTSIESGMVAVWLYPGVYTYTVTASGYYPYVGQITVVAGQPMIEHVRMIKIVEAPPVGTIIIAGKVVQEGLTPDIDGIPSVAVQLLDSNKNVIKQTTTDYTGRYSFEYLTSLGTYYVHVPPQTVGNLSIVPISDVQVNVTAAQLYPADVYVRTSTAQPTPTPPSPPAPTPPTQPPPAPSQPSQPTQPTQPPSAPPSQPTTSNYTTYAAVGIGALLVLAISLYLSRKKK